MSKEDIELIAQGCDLKKNEIELAKDLLSDLCITNIDDIDKIAINLDELSKEKYGYRATIMGSVIAKLEKIGIIGSVSDEYGIIPEEEITSQVEEYFKTKRKATPKAGNTMQKSPNDGDAR